jgi:hypothetical protein
VILKKVQPVEHVYRVWVVPVRGVGGMDAAVKPTWRYLRRPLTGTAQISRKDDRTTGYTLPKSRPPLIFTHRQCLTVCPSCLIRLGDGEP